ncbi:T-cell leukemia/lymphoma protein 1A [Ochotona princeps]|uniref:T-cell leukemia/lymphoma protein 1A n=1 Tax=Ochotona princeps TaxID=9978 RepID=UPI002714A80B|nr:T-cell leukemia/lymphoma protein 1A [Ochotona princeps]
MAQSQVSGLKMSVHPDRLWIWDNHTYLDEERRTWVPIIIKTEGRRQVVMRQEDMAVGEAMTPSQLTSFELPLLWQLYPRNRYRTSDSSFWRIVHHTKFSDREDMLLEQLPDPHSR